MGAKSKRVLSDEEAAKLSNEQFSKYYSGEWHPDDDLPTKPPAQEEENTPNAIKKRNAALREVTRATK